MKPKNEVEAYLLSNYTKDSGQMTVKEAIKLQQWTIADLFIRRALNDGDDAPNWGLTNVQEVYWFLCANKEFLIKHDMVSETGYSNWGFELWNNYDFDTMLNCID